jgi:hypothetical protein
VLGKVDGYHIYAMGVTMLGGQKESKKQKRFMFRGAELLLYPDRTLFSTEK